MVADIGGQGTLGGVCRRFRVMDQHVIPRLIFSGLRLVILIPLVVSLADFIARHHHATVAVAFVRYQLARFECRLVFGRAVFRNVKIGANQCLSNGFLTPDFTSA